ncbi:MAG: citrate lyase acyl carrier protein [Bacillota bacterium]|jgi:citrate lyase subunit gamma (acyl carrier protein)|nr:citrate lyase acyl carrier protein [Eubacteriales bacterium]MDD3536721.1 citrate lyase acyl carrier protein [Eubacteriales bacterium]MDD4286551.1 citrate lyase acyl carrier protein [Eubacteriales bacterium]MDI9492740.1 citrate lyase acyl carrier protein [Bacillota bacterium]NLV69512.1 citrate lyase acyl carrier protein [Clostridiales bacterium]
MKLMKTGTAGTMESNDIMVTLEPKETGGVQIALSSSVMQQFGRQIEAVIRQTLTELGIAHASVDAVDKGALDCTVRARVRTAAYRAADQQNYDWGAM